jgi:hypothetical protein
MVKQFLKALDCGFTAFINELYLPTFGFPLLSDSVADALEDEPVLRSGGGFRRGPVSSPVVEPGSAPGVVSPEGVDSPSTLSGHPTEFSEIEIRDLGQAARLFGNSEHGEYRVYWFDLAEKAFRIANSMK